MSQIVRNGTFTIGFSTVRRGFWAWLGWIIRWFTKSKFSHVWIRYPHNLYKQDVVVEADLKGIIEHPYKTYIHKIDGILELTPPHCIDIYKGMVAVGNMLGTPYDLKSMIGRAWVLIGRWLGAKWKNPWGNSRRDCCVDNVIRFLVGADFFNYGDLSPEEETPQSLYERLVKEGWKPLSE